MNKIHYFVSDYYDRNVISRIIDKYSVDPMEATRMFLSSETHALLEDADYGLTSFSELAIFDMWVCEHETGDLRNSEYLWGE